MEELKAKYQELNEAFKEKYHDLIVAIAEKNNVDMGVALDMLKANCRGGNYKYDGEFDLTNIADEYAKIHELSEKILNS